MTKSICLSLALSLLTLNPINADTTELKPRFKLSEFNLSFGTVRGSRPERIALSDFQKLAPGSALLASDFSGFSSRGFYHFKDMNQLQVSAGLRNTRKAHGAVYRFGFSYGSGQHADAYYHQYEQFLKDTLISPSTKRIYIDSIHGENYDFASRAMLLQIDLSAIWRSHKPNKMTLFGGIGFSGGASLWAETALSHKEYSILKYSGEHSYNENNITEQFTNQGQMILAVYLPFGIDYRLSKKHSFWKDLHLFQETRLRLQYYKLPELSAKTDGNYLMSVGIRYCPS